MKTRILLGMTPQWRPGLLALTLILAGCAAPATATKRTSDPPSQVEHPTASASQRTPRHALTVSVTLNQTHAVKGHTITGEAIIVNSTGHKLEIQDCNGSWLQVGLANDHVSFEPGWAACLTIPGTVLAAGTTRLQISVPSTYQQCTQNPSSGSPDSPACLHTADNGSFMPPLPAGTYRTTVAMLSPKGVTIPATPSVQVTLTS